MESNRKVYSVSGLSQGGLSLWLPEQQSQEDQDIFYVGALIQGHLNLRGVKHFIRARIRNVRRDAVGCEFEGCDHLVMQAVSKFLDPETLGAEMKPIPSSELGTLWYHGPSGTDLVMVRKSDGKFSAFTLYFLGSYVQWNEEGGVVSGRLSSSDTRSEVRGIVRLESLLLYPDSRPDSGKLSIAKKVILSSNLSQDIKTRCVRQLDRF